jgi:hypothetical protein
MSSLKVLTWTKLEVGMPNGAIWPLLMVKGNKLYALGGFNASFVQLFDIYSFSISPDGRLSKGVLIGELPKRASLNGISSQAVDTSAGVAFCPQNDSLGIQIISIANPNQVTWQEYIAPAFQEGLLVCDKGLLLNIGQDSTNTTYAFSLKYDGNGNINNYKSLNVSTPAPLLPGGGVIYRGVLIVTSWNTPGTFLASDPRWAKIANDGAPGKWTDFMGLNGVPNFLAPSGTFKVGKKVLCVTCFGPSTAFGFDAILDLYDDGTPKSWTTFPSINVPSGNEYSVATDGSKYAWGTGVSPDGGNTYTTDFWVLRIV